MKIAITGGSGQLGMLVLQRLIDDPEVHEVVSVDLARPPLTAAKLLPVQADVRSAELSRLIQGCDTVIHLVFVTNPPLSVTRKEMESINVHGSRNVFRAAAAAGVRQIIYVSSLAAYGIVPGHPAPLREEHPLRYQFDLPYAASRYEIEVFLDDFAAQHPDLCVTRLRPSILIGERMDHPLGQLLRHRLFPQVGPGGAPGAARRAPLPLVWDEDVADAVLLCLHRREAGVFNLSADEPLAPADLCSAGGLRLIQLPYRAVHAALRLAKLLQRLGVVGPAVDPATWPGWIAAMNVPLYPSSERARAVLGWRPRCATARDVIRHYVQVAPPAHIDAVKRLVFRPHRWGLLSPSGAAEGSHHRRPLPFQAPGTYKQIKVMK